MKMFLVFHLFPDTVHTMACYSDVIVMRHPEKGAVQVSAIKPFYF